MGESRHAGRRPSVGTEGQLRVAIDLGAGSGRALVGRLAEDEVRLTEVHRFHYDPRRVEGRLRWDVARLFDGLREGLKRAGQLAEAEGRRLASVGVDSWAVDYGLLDGQGRLVEEPVSYRDERTDRVMDEVFAIVPRQEVFARTGIQSLKLNTLFQLFAHARAGLPPAAARLLLIPDLCHQFLCGAETSERTNASTTQLLSAHLGSWDDDLIGRLGLPRALLPGVVPAGTPLGPLRPERLAESSLGGGLEVIAPATHDTASAVAGTPLQPGWAYISSGTWSLVGIEAEAPMLGDAVAAANFTNEGGAYGTVRLLKNVMGLWLLESCRAAWGEAGRNLGSTGGGPGSGRRASLEELLRAVADIDGFAGFIYPDAERFFNPADMAGEIAAALEATGQPAPKEPARLAKVILDSLALRYASVLETIERLTGRTIPGVHVVGGGSRNDYLNQATADASQRPVLAGPAEATAAGNLLVQAIAAGELSSLADGRRLLARALPPRRFAPRPGRAWAEATRRYRELEALA